MYSTTVQSMYLIIEVWHVALRLLWSVTTQGPLPLKSLEESKIQMCTVL